VPVVIDGGLTDRAHRASWLSWGSALGHEPTIYFVDAPAERRWERVQRRNAALDRDSVAVSREMFDFVETRFEPPSRDEAPLALVRS
jgi:predicted kinase